MSGAWTAAGIAALISAGAGYENNQQMIRRQDRETAASLRQLAQRNEQANKKTGELIKATADSTPDKAKASLLSQFIQEMQASQGGATKPLAQVGNVSDAYTRAANDAALGVSKYGADRAGLVSNIDAPALQRQGEAADLMRYGTDIGQIKRQSAADQFLSEMRLRGIRANPWLTALQSVAGAYAKSGGGTAGSSSGDAWSQGNTASMGGGYTVNMPNY